MKCYFSWNPEYHTAQQRVVNRLQFIQLPPGLQPQLSPWSAIGEIFRYTVKGPGYSLAELKTAEDFILERQFRQVPGVVDVVGFGGETKEFHVDVDPYRLKGHALTLAQLTQGIANAMEIIRGQLSPMYVQHEAIESQKAMVGSPNHTVVYIPVGPMGVPLTGTFNASAK